MAITKPAKKTIERALQIKKVREFIIKNPGCSVTDIRNAGFRADYVWRLVHLKIVRCKYQAGKPCYWAIAAPELPIE